MSSKKLPPAKVQAYADTNGIPPLAEQPSADTKADSTHDEDAPTGQELADLADQVEMICNEFLIPIAQQTKTKQTGLHKQQLIRFLKTAAMGLRHQANNALQTEALEAAFSKPKPIHTPEEAKFWAEFEAEKAR